MLSLKNRLKKKKDFQKVFQKGKGIKENSLTFKWIFNNLNGSRFGIVVSQKVSKKSVFRNQIKRRLRAKLRLLLPSFKKNIDGVIIVHPGGAKIKEELVENLNKIFLKAKLLKE